MFLNDFLDDGKSETGTAGPATRALVTRIVAAVIVYVGGFSHSTGQENSSTSSERHSADAARCIGCPTRIPGGRRIEATYRKVPISGCRED